MRVPTSPRCARSRSARSLAAALGLSLLALGCSDHRPQSVLHSSHAVGSQVDHPDPLASGSRRFTVDPNGGGESSNLKITGLFWGRLVQVRDALDALQHSNLVVGEDISTDIDFLVETNAVTLVTTVTIKYPYTPSLLVNGIETSAYQRAFERLQQNLGPIEDKSLAPGELPPFTLLPRNCAIMIQFSDLLDETLISNVNVRLLAGYPPSTPLDARVLADPNHGETRDLDGDGIAEFHTTRVLVDPSVTPFEASIANPPISPNAVGLPASVTQNQPNVVLRIPTRTDGKVGQNSVLRNLSGHPVAFSSNGSRDTDSSTDDIVRAARSGGKTELTGDLNNGFLADSIAPKVLGTQPISLGSPSGGPTEFTSVLTFLTSTCSMPTKIGDVLQQPGVFAEVTAVSFPVGTQIPEVHYRVVFPPGGVLNPGQGTLSTVWDPVVNQNKEACFVRFPSVGQAPATRVATDSSVVVKFNEPMDPDSLSVFETFTATLVNPLTTTPSERQFIIGTITPTSDAQEFRLQPSLPFPHVAGSSEALFLNVPRGVNGPFDLAGNRIANALPPVVFTIDPAEATETSSSVVLRFSSSDEIGNNGRPEVRGQIQVDFVEGELEPRQVVHFASTIDRTNPVVGNMAVAVNAEQTPLARLGSKLMTVWRYCDAGFALLDETKFNLDVEGLAWAPRGGAVIADAYTRFEINLCHSKRLPDEGTIPPATTFPNSGLLATYSLNLLSPEHDPQRVVHDRSRGYTVNPSDRFVSTSGTVMMPYPLNRGLAPDQFSYYTWRDTALLDLGGPQGAGAELVIMGNLGLSTLGNGVPFGVNVVPTIGLPLLMEYRCYPDDAALGLNQFDVSNVTAGGQPKTRAFSTGGVQVGGQTVPKDPDLESTATGGFNSASAPPGATTAGIDNVFYLGELNLVTRVSRAHMMWFDTTIASPLYASPILEPSPEKQPQGTSIVLAFRGATNITSTSTALNDATTLDNYGNIGTGVTFLNADNTWKSNIAQINSARFYQTRISFIGNGATNLAPVLSSLGIAFH